MTETTDNQRWRYQFVLQRTYEAAYAVEHSYVEQVKAKYVKELSEVQEERSMLEKDLCAQGRTLATRVTGYVIPMLNELRKQLPYLSLSQGMASDPGWRPDGWLKEYLVGELWMALYASCRKPTDEGHRDGEIHDYSALGEVITNAIDDLEQMEFSDYLQLHEYVDRVRLQMVLAPTS